MYKTFRLKDFEKSMKSLMRSGKMSKKVSDDIEFIIDQLKYKIPLHIKYKDHKLKGKMKGLRECHVKGDVLLLYRLLESENVLLLVDIGSHSELFN